MPAVLDAPVQDIDLGAFTPTHVIDDATGRDLMADTRDLRFAHEMAGADPRSAAVSELVERGRGPLAGGATGLAATAYMANLPAEGQYVMDPRLFGRETERNDMPLETKALSLGGAPIDLRIPNVGILANVRLVVKGTLTVSATGTTTAGYQWPWNLLKRVSVNLQGQTGLINAEGQDLRARRQRVYRNPREHVSVAPATHTDTCDPNPAAISSGTHAVTLVYDIPIVHDSYSLTGAVYAQSDAVYLNWRIQPGTASELFTLAGGAPDPTFTGTIYTTVTFYDIPFADKDGRRLLLLPDLRWLHSIMCTDKPYANTGDVEAEVIRVAGQLTMLGVYLDNGGKAQIDVSAWERFSMKYGGNREPRVFQPIEQLIEKNVQDYNGRIRPGFALLDFEIDNPDRDLVYPKGVTELKVTPRVAAGTTVNANARVHTLYETLFQGAAGAGA